MIKEFKERLTEECFAGGIGEDKPIALATGGFSGLFEKAGLFVCRYPRFSSQRTQSRFGK